MIASWWWCTERHIHSNALVFVNHFYSDSNGRATESKNDKSEIIVRQEQKCCP